MKLFTFLSILILCGSVQAELEGKYELVSGKLGDCPDGTLHTIMRKGKPGRIFLFGGAHSWPMNMNDVSEMREVVSGGGTYFREYNKSNDKFEYKTTISKIPGVEGDIVVKEKIYLQDGGLIYELENGPTKVKCKLKRVGQP
jgi:hypothetical protein